ncbi:MAG TPA: hypothetical protein VIN93_09785 [Bryobacteraceae bacterium]
MKDQILDYRSVLAYNREVFLIEHGELIKAFSAIDANFSALVEAPRTMRDASGKSYVSLIPFLLLFQRQSRAAFEAFAVHQSYQGWVLLRPGIESVLIIGKWVDDPANAKIWQNRNKEPNRKEHRKAYQNAYSGPALRSKCLPSSERIQTVLSKVNDNFVHANPDYYDRHLKAGAGDPGYVNFWLDYFDDDTLLETHVLAFLHLVLVMQEALLDLLNRQFLTPAGLRTSLASFDSKFGARTVELAAASDEAATTLGQRGLIAAPARGT